MDRQRVIELIGAFALGGGFVALTYELVGVGPTAPPGSNDPAAVAENGNASPESPGDPARGDGADADADAAADDDSQPGAQDDGAADGDLIIAEDNVPPYLVPDEQGQYTAYPPIVRGEPEPFDEEAEAKYPGHAIVTSLAAIVRRDADLESPVIGVLSAGTRVRTDIERTFGGGCKPGWNRVFPRGWICRKAGLRVAETPPESSHVVSSVRAKLDQPLPYEYWRVKDEMTPFFHRLPSFEEQNAADTAGSAWYATKGRDPMPLASEGRPSEVPGVVREYMNAGYYVTKGGEEVKSKRRFLRTLRGAYARKYQLKPKDAPQFKGRVLSGVEDLPVYFIRRAMPLMKRESEGSDVLIKTETIPERLETHGFVDSVYIGNNVYYVDGEGLLMRGYAVGKAFKLKRPPGVGETERWLHIDLSEQTLVAYHGDVPVFATLVSTGKEPGMTPIGVHRVQTKLVAASMRDQPKEDAAYSIDDVPWTQYFSGAVALHGAFWHAGFGQVRSHGCVNLSPSDARWLFGFTDPPLPTDWHAVSPTRGTPEGSAIVVTE